MIRPDLIVIHYVIKIIFKETRLLETLLEVTRQHEMLLTMVSEIIIRFIDVVVSAKMLKTIEFSFINEIITILIQFVGKFQDVVMSSFLNGANFRYINKQILMNCLRILLLMSRK